MSKNVIKGTFFSIMVTVMAYLTAYGVALL
jgi:hypothetical protein